MHRGIRGAGEWCRWSPRIALAGNLAARQIAQYAATVLNAAVADGLIVANPAGGAVRPRVDALPLVPLTDGGVDALQGAAPGWHERARSTVPVGFRRDLLCPARVLGVID